MSFPFLVLIPDVFVISGGHAVVNVSILPSLTAELHFHSVFSVVGGNETPAATSDSISMTSSLLSVPTADRAKRSAHLEVNEIIEAQRNVTLRIWLLFKPRAHSKPLIFRCVLCAYLIPSTLMALNPGSLSKAYCICRRRSAFNYLIYQKKTASACLYRV